ncbi:MAG: N-acetylmuramoyl-L-alanine amidase [Ruminococcaceae bacterium]|nr:N-acetylmuramoyl-L-alanine amidase [Oscillospiraceae bacterium]
MEPIEPIKIYIDQGHNPTGTHNAGAQGNGLCEENITFAVGLELAALLEADGRFEVRLSRPTAETVLGTNNSESLAARSGDANAWGADYFISIHANSYTNDTANGIEAFAYSDAGEAFSLGTELVDALVAATGFAKRGMKVRTDLHVLKNTQMPAVLVEIGFITNPTEAALMASDPALFARGLYQGILACFQN